MDRKVKGQSRSKNKVYIKRKIIFISLPVIVITSHCHHWPTSASVVVFLCLCLCPAKLVANISLTLTGDTTTQIMAPTVGEALQQIFRQLSFKGFHPPSLPLAEWKVWFFFICKITIYNFSTRI